MAGAILLSLMAAQLGTSASPVAAGEHWSSRVSASARATVRILSGARVSLGGAAQPDGYKVQDAQVRLEDGSSRPARLVEFQ